MTKVTCIVLLNALTILLGYACKMVFHQIAIISNVQVLLIWWYGYIKIIENINKFIYWNFELN